MYKEMIQKHDILQARSIENKNNKVPTSYLN